MENVCSQLEEYFRMLLNDPDFYCERIYMFFNLHSLFQMMPIMEEFRQLNSRGRESSHMHLHLSEIHKKDTFEENKTPSDPHKSNKIR